MYGLTERTQWLSHVVLVSMLSSTACGPTVTSMVWRISVISAVRRVPSQGAECSGNRQGYP